MLVCKDCGKEYEDYDEIDNWKEIGRAHVYSPHT